jgi:hypothetical protein
MQASLVSVYITAMYEAYGQRDVTLTFNSSMTTVAIFLDIESAVDTKWHFRLLYKLSKLEFSDNLIKVITTFLL